MTNVGTIENLTKIDDEKKFPKVALLGERPQISGKTEEEMKLWTYEYMMM